MLPTNVRVVPNYWGYFEAMPRPAIIDSYRETNKPDDGKRYPPIGEDGTKYIMLNGEPHQAIRNDTLYQYNLENHEKLSTKDLLKAMSPEERNIAAEIMHLTLSLLAEKKAHKDAARYTLSATTNHTPAQEELQKKARNTLLNVGLSKIQTLFAQADELYGVAIDVCSTEDVNPLPLSRLRPFFKEFFDNYAKIKEKYGPQKESLPHGIARLEDPLYQRLKQDSIPLPQEWKSIPCPYIKREAPNFLEQPLTYEQAAGYFSYLIKIGFSREQLIKEFTKFTTANPGTISQRIYYEISPESDPSKIALEISYIAHCEALEPKNSLGICCEPNWAKEPINLSINRQSFPCKRYIPIANREWKFVILDEQGHIVRWEAGANRSGKKDGCLPLEIYLNEVNFN